VPAGTWTKYFIDEYRPLLTPWSLLKRPHRDMHSLKEIFGVKAYSSVEFHDSGFDQTLRVHNFRIVTEDAHTVLAVQGSAVAK
jgi:hypothetical protein